MTSKQATVQVFLEDVIDLAIAVKRSSEKCKNLRTFVKQLKKGRKR